MQSENAARGDARGFRPHATRVQAPPPCEGLPTQRRLRALGRPSAAAPLEAFA